MKKYCLLLILVLISCATQAQTRPAAVPDTTAMADSIKTEVLMANTQLLQQLDSMRRVDSTRKAVLEEELKSLKTTDNLKKQELLAELEKIKADEREKLAKKRSQIDSLKQVVSGYPVSPFLDTILYVYTALGPFSPSMRAINTEKRIEEMEDDMLFHVDSLIIFNSEQTVDLLYRDVIILSITDADALWMGMSKAELGKYYKDRIAKSISDYRSATSVQTLLKEIGLALLVVIFVYFLIKYLNKGYKLLRVKIRDGRDKWIKGIKVRGYELFTAQKQVVAMHIALNIIRWILIFLIIYLMLPVLFGIFPWTKTLSGTLFGYVLNPLKNIFMAIWDYIPKLISILIILFVFRYVFKALKFFKNEVERGVLVIPGFYTEWASPTYQIIRVLIIAFMLIVIFPFLPGSDSAVFRGVSVFLGVLFTFSSSGSLSNIFAGLVLTYMRAFKIGDRVKIGESVGDIIEKTLLVTRLRTIKNEDITIPNSTVLNSHTINYSAAAGEIGLIVHSTVTIGYDVPWKHVHELLINAASDTVYIINNPKPFVLQTSLDDFYVSYQVNAYTKEPSKQAEIYSSLHQNIQDKFNEAGVEIMSPHYKALRDGNQATIPADYLPAEYIAPPFKVDAKGKDEKK
ncbi:MAG TPA: mechanosensitive ion channel domain-containing protein [Flavipsychrobacter sp.]